MAARIAIQGGTGKTGRAVAAALASRGAEPVPLGRAADISAELAGCVSAYLIAPNLHQDEPGYVTAALAALAAAGIGRVAYHSVTAPYAPQLPHHLGKAVAEDLVRRSGLEWTILQPCAYVQNFVPALRQAAPALRVAYRTDAAFGLVDLADVGAAAATVLLEDGHAGSTYELGGPALVTVADVARAAADVLGRSVPAERIDYVEWATAAEQMDARERDWLLAMFAYYDGHGLPAGPLALRALLGREPTGLQETLARELAGPTRW